MVVLHVETVTADKVCYISALNTLSPTLATFSLVLCVILELSQTTTVYRKTNAETAFQKIHYVSFVGSKT